MMEKSKVRDLMLLSAEYVLISQWKGSWSPEQAEAGEKDLLALEARFRLILGKTVANNMIIKLNQMRG